MKKMFLAALAMAALLTSCGEDKGVQLFNGKDLTGWVAYADPSSDVTPEQLFTVQNGVIHALGMPCVRLRSMPTMWLMPNSAGPMVRALTVDSSSACRKAMPSGLV